jgi:hypothetical protein
MFPKFYIRRVQLVNLLPTGCTARVRFLVAQEHFFATTFRQALQPTQPPIKWVLCSFHKGITDNTWNLNSCRSS